ncbi:MAG: PIN domain-containing protein [Actinomycetes bacterium]
MVDTNVVVSGVLRFGQGSTPAVILDRMLSGRLPHVLSADLLGEYRRVLLRPRLVARHGWGEPQVDVLLAALTIAAYLRQPAALALGEPDDSAPSCPAGDEHVVRLLVGEPWAALVSGDRRLLDALRGWRDALTPAEAVAEQVADDG